MKSVIFFLLCAPTVPVCGGLLSPTGSAQEQLSFSALCTKGAAQKNPGSMMPDPFHSYTRPAASRTADPPVEITLAVTLPLPARDPAPTDFGFFPGGTLLQIVVSGTVNLGPRATTTNPDGSLARPVADPNCDSCWAGYQYFVPGARYPTVAGGDGINHFPGGGGNYDLLYGNHSPWAKEGAITTDTTDPQAIRFGEVAGTFSSHPAPNSLDWFAIGYGGTFQIPGGGAHLYLVVPDTYYPNNSGDYTVQVNLVPEPLSLALVLFGLILLGVTVRLNRVRCSRR